MEITFNTGLIQIIGIASNLAGVIALIYAIKSFNRNTKVKEAEFLVNLYGRFHRERQDILDNPKELKILSEAWGTSEESVIKDSMTSFWVNRAFLLYQLHEDGQLNTNTWLHHERDIKRLFTDDLIIARWNTIHDLYPDDFQKFIDSYILHEPK